jgi:glucokinase
VGDVTNAIGIDFGGTKMLGALIDGSGNILETDRVPTPYDANELLMSMSDLVITLEKRAGVQASGVGVGAAGLVNRNGELVFGPNVGGVTRVKIQTSLEEKLPSHIIRVENDNTCATWGEVRFGAGRGAQEAIFVGLGTGIGGGFVSMGEPALGYNGFAAEIGHMTVSVDGVDCVCGKRGCWEAYASGRALGRLGREAAASGRGHRILEIAGAVDDVRGEHVTKAAREGDRGAKVVMDEFARWVAVGLDNLITILDPELVVMGGGMSAEFDLFLPQMQKQLKELMYAGAHRPDVPIKGAELGERAGVIGAAMMVHDALAADKMS